MFTAVKTLEKMLFYVLIFTALGQIPFQGKNLERHYHEFVNSSGFQDFFWTLASPITWTVQKSAKLVGIKIKDSDLPQNEESSAR